MNIGYQPPLGAAYLPELDPLNQERTYTRVSYDGTSCIMEPHEAAALVAAALIARKAMHDGSG